MLQSSSCHTFVEQSKAYCIHWDWIWEINPIIYADWPSESISHIHAPVSCVPIGHTPVASQQQAVWVINSLASSLAQEHIAIMEQHREHGTTRPCEWFKYQEKSHLAETDLLNQSKHKKSFRGLAKGNVPY